MYRYVKNLSSKIANMFHSFKASFFLGADLLLKNSN